MRRERGSHSNELMKGNMRLREIVHKNGSGFADSCYSIFLYLGIGRKDSFGEALDHGSRKGEVLLPSISGPDGQLQGRIKKQRCLNRRKGVGERDNGIIYFDVDAIFFFVGGSFIGSGGNLGCVAFAGRHFD